MSITVAAKGPGRKMAEEYPNTEHLDSPLSDFQAQEFMIEQAIKRMSKAALVQVTKVSTNGSVAPVGTVSIAPLVKMQDALGGVRNHGIINSVPYFRMQGGKDQAIIMDPKVGSIGVAIFMDRDTSSAKKNNAQWDGTKDSTKAQSPPGSYRHHDMADAFFFGCFLGAAPTSYLRFASDGTLELSPDNGVTIVRVKKDELTMITSGKLVRVTPTRVDLGALAGQAVVTVGGPSPSVFAEA